MNRDLIYKKEFFDFVKSRSPRLGVLIEIENSQDVNMYHLEQCDRVEFYVNAMDLYTAFTAGAMCSLKKVSKSDYE